MRQVVVLGSVIALGLCTQVFAKDEFSYSYAELGYINSESGNLDGDGLNLFGSYAFANKAHAFASYSDQDFDFGIGVKFFQIGAGLNLALAPNLDFITRLSYVEVDVDGPGFSTEDDGFALGASLRARVAQQIELSAGFNYQDLENGGDDTSLNAGARYYFTDKLAAALDVLQNDDDTTLILGARYEFGR